MVAGSIRIQVLQLHHDPGGPKYPNVGYLGFLCSEA